MNNRPLIGCARMYAVTETAAAAWRQILRRVSVTAKVPLDVIDYLPPADLEDLWARSDLGAVFICGYPFTLAGFRHRLIVAPVPSPGRYNDLPVYFTDFIVRNDSPYYQLADTFGGTLAWTVAHSHSGYNAVRHHLLSYRTPERPLLYTDTVGPVLTPAGSVKSVLDGEADVAPLDSWVYDIWRVEGDERASRCRVVASTMASPIPPLVASPHISLEIWGRLREAFLSLHRQPEMKPYLQSLALSRFSDVEVADYRIIAKRAGLAIEAGYPAPG